MKKIELTDEELEMMNYNDIAHVILKENGKKMKIIDLFQEIGKVMGLQEEEYQSHITDFFELLSTDKRFIMLDDGYWDLRIKHNKGMQLENDDEDEEEILLEDENNIDEEEYEDEEKESDDDVEDDDLADLVIIDDTDEENNM